MKKTFLSWNVNGIRAVEKKGFIEWLKKVSPDILAIQETKASPDQLSDNLKSPEGYATYWSAAVKKGYSGVGVYSKEEPEKVECGFGIKEFDQEGRILVLEYEKLFFYNIYFPNGKMGPQRLDYKLRFYKAFLEDVSKRKKKKAVIVTGDVNTAHTEIDLARPKENSDVSGFLPEERRWLDKFIESGLVDTFRIFNKDGGHYTWWDLKSGARKRNVGWRIDYFYVDHEHAGMVKKSFIMKDVFGSDHCPIGIEISG